MLVARCMLANFRRLDRLAWWGGLNTRASLDEDRVPLVRQRLVHHWAVLVALNVLFKPLCWAAPGHCANLLAGHSPVGEALKYLEALLSISDGTKVDECIAQSSLRLEINGQISKVVCAC